MAEHSDMDELHEDLHGTLRTFVTAAAALGQQAARIRAQEDDAERNRIIAAYQEAQATLAQVATVVTQRWRMDITDPHRAEQTRATEASEPGRQERERAEKERRPAPEGATRGDGPPPGTTEGAETIHAAAAQVRPEAAYTRTSPEELAGLDEETRTARTLSAESYPLPVSTMIGRGPRRARHTAPPRRDGRGRGEELGR